MASSKQAAMAAPLVALGLWTAWFLFKDAKQELGSFNAGCPHCVSYSFRFGHEDIDHFLCTLVLFFREALSTTHGTLISIYLLTVALSVFTFMSVEGSRLGHSWLLSFTPIYALLFQSAGISIVVPAVWLPVYIMSGGVDKTISRKKLSVQRVIFIKVFMLLTEFISVALLFPLKKTNKDFLIFLFQFAPIVCSILWLPFSSRDNAEQSLGHRAVMVLHSIQAGVGLVGHLIGLVFLMEDPEVIRLSFGLLLKHHGTSWCSYFLLMDWLVLFAAFVYLAYIQYGVQVALCVLFGAALIGPGTALSLYFVYVEHNLLKVYNEQLIKNKQH